MDTSDGKNRDYKMNAVAFIGNISSSVLLIYSNKVLMSGNGYKFRFATTLCALHFLTCALGTSLLKSAGKIRRTKISQRDLVVFAIAGNVSIASLNLSLMLNPVAFYQIAKLCIIPCACAIEAVWLKRQFSTATLASIALVLCGVFIVTVTDLGAKVDAVGAAVALTSIVSSALQQIFCRTMQQRNGLGFLEFLSHSAPAQGVSLVFVGPFLDHWIGGRWLLDYKWTGGSGFALTVSCLVAVAVNASQFACLGRFQATTFQVLGHAKTILVLLLGWALLGDTITGTQLFGMALTITGMILYGYFSSQKSSTQSRPEESQRELQSNGLVTDKLSQRQHGQRRSQQAKTSTNV